MNMENFMRKSSVVAILALVCCALWGSAFPCVKIGYDLFCIEEVGSQILFAGYRFFLAGIFTWVLGCIFEKRILTMKKSSIPYVCGQGLLQTTLQYFFFYIGLANTTGAKGSVINAANAFVSILVAPLLIKSEKMTWRKAIGCMLGFAGVIIINIAPGAWGSGFKLTGEGFVLIMLISVSSFNSIAAVCIVLQLFRICNSRFLRIYDQNSDTYTNQCRYRLQ